jgi:hypothetical protein
MTRAFHVPEGSQTAMELLVLLLALGQLNLALEPDWSKLTAAELHALNASAFANITASQISQIPPAACAGFLSEQINAIRSGLSVCFMAVLIINSDKSLDNW